VGETGTKVFALSVRVFWQDGKRFTASDLSFSCIKTTPVNKLQTRRDQSQKAAYGFQNHVTSLKILHSRDHEVDYCPQHPSWRCSNTSNEQTRLISNVSEHGPSFFFFFSFYLSDTKLLLCVCVLGYSSRKGVPICTTIGMLIPWSEKGLSERSKFQKSVLGLKPCEDGLRILETMRDTRMSPRTKFLVSVRRLQE
jgi:hypothetical protein